VTSRHLRTAAAVGLRFASDTHDHAACAAGAAAARVLPARRGGSPERRAAGAGGAARWIHCGRLINHVVGGGASDGGLTTLTHVLSTIGSQTVLLPVTAILAVWLVGRRALVPAVLLVACWGGAFALYSLGKLCVQRRRPPMDIWLTNVGKTTSFPSGHATQSLSTFVALAVVSAAWLPTLNWPSSVLASVLAAGIGWSRVDLGVHCTPTLRPDTCSPASGSRSFSGRPRQHSRPSSRCVLYVDAHSDGMMRGGIAAQFSCPSSRQPATPRRPR